MRTWKSAIEDAEAEVKKLKRQKTLLFRQIRSIHDRALIISDQLGNMLNEEHWRKERERQKKLKEYDFSKGVRGKYSKEKSSLNDKGNKFGKISVWMEEPKRKASPMAKRTPNKKLSLGNLHRIKTKEEAEQFIKEYLKVFDREQPKMPNEERMRIIKNNIGYCSGYYDSKVASRILELFDTCHPFFKHHVNGKSRPTSKEAFEVGVKMGKAMRKKKGE